MNLIEWALLVALSLLWGGSYFFVGLAVRELPTFTIVVARVGIAAVALHILLRILGQTFPREWPVLRAFLIMGLANNVVPFGLIVWGQSHVASSVAAILNATTPVFAVVVAHYFAHDERLTPARVVGVVLGFAGVAVMMGADAVGTLGLQAGAQVAFLGAGLAYSLASVYGRRFTKMGVTPMATATGQVTASSIVLIPLVAFVDRPWTLASPSTDTVLALVALGVFSTALAYVLYFRILATAGATNLMLVTLLIPVSASAFGVVILGEVLGVHHVLGMALIAGGLLTIDGRLINVLLRRAPESESLE